MTTWISGKQHHRNC